MIQPMDAHQIVEAAMDLPPAQRAKLADALMASLAQPAPPSLNLAWRSEVARRLGELEADPSIGVPAAVVDAELDQLLV